MLFSKEQTILFAGDSITDANRLGPNKPYGDGYVSQVRNLLVARYPDLELRFLNRGVSGNTTRDLLARWDRDVLAEKPDWLSLMIGINDVWRSFDGQPSAAVSLPEYIANLHSLLDRVQARTKARLILLTPYMIEGNHKQPMRAAMDRYGDAVKTVAAEYRAIFVDTQAAFDEALQHTSPRDWADDKIHPGGAGHAIIALAFLRAVGFEL